MPEPGLIGDYLTALSSQLPAPIVEELADGLDQTCQYYLNQGLDVNAATGAAPAARKTPSPRSAWLCSCRARRSLMLLSTGSTTTDPASSTIPSVLGRGCASVTSDHAGCATT
jgi:hypothetical protein